MVQKYTFHVQKREKERDGGGGQWGRPKILQAAMRWRMKKIPNYLGLRIHPNKSQIYTLKARCSDLTSTISIKSSNNVLTGSGAN